MEEEETRDSFFITMEKEENPRYQIAARAECKTSGCEFEQEGICYFDRAGLIEQWGGENNIVPFCQIHHANNQFADPPHQEFSIFRTDGREEAGEGQEQIGFLVAATSITSGGISPLSLDRLLEEYSREE